MEETYQLPDGLFVVGLIIALAVLLVTLVRAYMRSRGGRHDTSTLDKAILAGLAALGAWVVLSLAWVLIAEPGALADPVKIIGMTLVFFAIGIGLAFAVAWVVGRIASAARR